MCRRSLDAGPVAAGARRPAGAWIGPGVDDEVSVADWVVAGCELEHPVEDEPAAAGSTAVEAEHELVEIAGQVRVVDGPLVGVGGPRFSVHRE